MTGSLKSLPQCAHGRRITRWEHEAILDAMAQRVRDHPQIMQQWQQLAEHPFGTPDRYSVPLNDIVLPKDRRGQVDQVDMHPRQAVVR